jgi:hypothetical protein
MLRWLQRLFCRLGIHDWVTAEPNEAGGYFQQCFVCYQKRECRCRSCRLSRRLKSPAVVERADWPERE